MEDSMRKLLMTSALVMPLMALPLAAQQTPPLVQDGQQDETEQAMPEAETPEDGAETADDPTAADQDPEIADDPAAAGEDPALADDPAAETDADLADDPAAETDAEIADDPAAAGEDPTLADDPAAAPDAEMADDPAAEDEAAVAETEPSPDAPLVTEQQPNELRGDWVIGTSVTSPDGETIGSIQDLIIDEEEGRVTAAVLSVGGFLGIGAKNIAVAWDELQMSFDAREITLDLTREEAEEAPEYVFRDRAEAPAAEPVADPAAPPPGGEPAPAPGGVN
jgi:hypothetical protein